MCITRDGHNYLLNMPKLLRYTAKRSPMQNAALTFMILVAALLLAGAIPTQWWAWKYNFDGRLGTPLLRTAHWAIYQPVAWIVWGWKYADVPFLRETTHTMFLIAAFAEVSAMIFAGIVGYKLANYNSGMEGLHGTAHFAETEDVDATGFVDVPGHSSQGVIVGSVIQDSKGAVIHPHHPKFDHRYEQIMVRQGWKQRYRRVVKRDSNGRPMFKIRKSVVKTVKLLRDGGNTHLFGFCPTRSGKGVGMVIPTLLTWKHSVMVNDPKGEAWALTAGFRAAAGTRAIKFEPAGIDGTGARWNPLDEIRIFSLRDVADAQMIMSMACDPKGKGLEDYFDKAGYEFLTAVALHVRYSSPTGSLAGCASFLGDPLWDNDKQMYAEMISFAHDPDGKMNWVDSLGKPTKTHPMIANAAKTMLNKEDKDRSGVLSTAKSLLSLYLDPIVAQNTNTSDFLVRDLMTSKEPVSLYYVVSPDDMERMTPLTRLFYAIFLRRNASEMKFEGGRSVASYTHPLLMIIDEAASLQKLPILQEALGYVAGYGIRMFFLVQDIVQIEELYGDKQSFDSGAETRIAYAPNKIETAEKLARMTGKTTVTEDSGSRSKDVIGIKAGNVTVSTSKTGRDLMSADEILKMHDQDMVVFVKGKAPIYGRKAFYYENPVLQKRASIPPPKMSARLRVAASDALKAAAAEAAAAIAAGVEPPKMRAGITQSVAAKSSAPQANPTRFNEPQPTTGADAGQGAQTDADKPRSRYADQIKPLTPEERQQVADLVASVGVVKKVESVSAF